MFQSAEIVHVAFHEIHALIQQIILRLHLLRHANGWRGGIFPRFEDGLFGRLVAFAELMPSLRLDLSSLLPWLTHRSG